MTAIAFLTSKELLAPEAKSLMVSPPHTYKPLDLVKLLDEYRDIHAKSLVSQTEDALLLILQEIKDSLPRVQAEALIDRITVKFNEHEKVTQTKE